MQQFILLVFSILVLGSVLVKCDICTQDQFQCSTTLNCIPLSWKCDDDVDCGDNDDSDEKKCPPKTCSSDEIQCNDTKCIPQRWQCDGEFDCDDHSDEDEKRCASKTCKPDEFSCGGQTCIPQLWHCDHTDDCPGGQDEVGCGEATTCSPEEIKCNNGRCINNRWHCDGDNDCGDNSDEENCQIKFCKDDEFGCKNSTKCIAKTWRCDGDFDCPDHSDEMECSASTHVDTCSTTHFSCKVTKECIHKSWKCDGEKDCEDGSDEDNDCVYTCRADHFKCENHHCIHEVMRCDGNEDCIDGSDEKNCSVPQKCSSDDFDCSLGLGTHCISRDRICNGVVDCHNAVDEDADMCKKGNPCEKNPNICLAHGICRNQFNGSYICECHAGFAKANGTEICKDIDECSLDHRVCSQICQNTKGSYKCSCYEGYTLEKHYHCRVDGELPWLIFANRRDIRRLRVDSGIMETLVEETENSIALDYDFKNNYLFYTDSATEQILRVNLTPNGSFVKKEIIINEGIKAPDGLAVDWLYNHIYWTDTGLDQISVADYFGNKQKTLISTGLDDPRAIAVDPVNGYMYWSDWGMKPKIERCGMDGQGRQELVVKKEGLDIIEWPNGLTIDYIDERLYWIDAKLHRIGTSNFDGTDVRTVITNGEDIKMPFSLAVFEDTLYWTDWSTDSIRSVDKFSGTKLKTLSLGLYSVMDIKVYHERKQQSKTPAVNQCTLNLALCSFLCLPSPGSQKKYVCVCKDGETLQPNGSCSTVITTLPLTTPKPAVTSTPAITTHKLGPSYTDANQHHDVANSTDRAELSVQAERSVGLVATITAGIVVAALVVVIVIGLFVYRRYNARNQKSMNFDNPVYRKTTTSADEQCMISPDEEIQSSHQPLTANISENV
ncbi:hypothetical protein ACJMK2_040515 [Sinanodonta woodiana]|uniref:EGF-like domain-containing protein n=1 Tax=Sinanodonta woodiana TaxID=1069815 RepID=A0ABD3W2L4_SINWO